MKRIPVIVIILAVLVSQHVLSQDITKSVVGSCGQTQSVEGTKVSWTIGEPVVGTMTGGGHQIGNGFLPSLDFSVLITPEKENISSIEVYPNPASEFIMCKNDSNGKLFIQVIATEGKEVLTTTVNSGDKINITFLKEGMYFLKVTDLLTKQVNSYKMAVSR